MFCLRIFIKDHIFWGEGSWDFLIKKKHKKVQVKEDILCLKCECILIVVADHTEKNLKIFPYRHAHKALWS